MLDRRQISGHIICTPRFANTIDVWRPVANHHRVGCLFEGICLDLFGCNTGVLPRSRRRSSRAALATAFDWLSMFLSAFSASRS